MRIGFDLRPCFKRNSRRRGIGKTHHRVAQEVLRLQAPEEYVFFLPPGAVCDLEGNYGVETVPALRRPSRLSWLTDVFFLPRSIRRSRLDAFVASEITSIPRSPGTRVWATVYDLIPLVFWEETLRTVPWDYAQGLRWAFRRIRTADKIVTCSHYSKSDICGLLEVEEARVEVVYLGCDESFQPVEAEAARAALAERYALSGPFLLYVGGSDFRKNLPFLIRAFSQILRRGYEGRLALVGETFAWDIPETRILREEASRLGLQSEVVFPGYVPDVDLKLFYSVCDLFLFPSRYEGFGLPILEALACGAPVLAGRTSSIPEVGGEAVVYFDPQEEDSLLEAFDRVYSDGALREKLRQAGFQQAARFRWKQTARQLRDLFSQK